MRFQAGLMKNFVLSLIVFFLAASGAFAQSSTNSPQSDNPNIPPLVQHLPNWKNAQSQAVYIRTNDDLRKVLGNRPVFSLITFEGGTEAATASYPAGKLLIVEYPTPQFSIDADNRIKQFFADNQPNPAVYFRRVGNYEVFVFDASDETAANDLMDQVKYQKTVQWLGKDPFLYEKAQRADIKTTGEIFISTILSILLGLSFALCTGGAIGMFIFYLRKQKRASISAFTDAGGMTRLNLDDLTSENAGLLKE